MIIKIRIAIIIIRRKTIITIRKIVTIVIYIYFSGPRKIVQDG
jgi:hypothetical protein